jgi:hypothetical protein
MNRANLVNALLFQAAWFGCVLGGSIGSIRWGAMALAGMVAFAAMRDRLRSDLGWALAAAGVGFCLDTLWIRIGVLDYSGAGVAPVWIVLLWASVGLSVNHSLAPFVARPWIGGTLAGLSAPVSYLGGERLGAVVVSDPVQLALVAAVWCAVFTVGFASARAIQARIAVPRRTGS